ncbi:spermidine synthase [Arthrobacter sp. AOP36-A1-22]|uniref:spermidine synthase n=1 Tax=unclassified Arthrobacter TaxID=235627 RepID=UPI0040339514
MAKSRSRGNSSGKTRPRKTTAGPAERRDPQPGDYPIDTGTATLERDPYDDGGWILKVNGVPSSHVDVGDPLRLDFEYMRWMAALVGARYPQERDGGGPRLRALHLGGGACSMARWIAAAYPEARQVVVELDGRLAELVRGWFDLPRAPKLRLRVGEAGEVLRSLTDDTRDLLIRDVFAGDKTPADLTTVGFTREAARVLAGEGLYIVNCGDTPKLETARREAATIGAVFAHTAIVADPAMLKGRRYGNMVIAGSNAPIPAGPGMLRELLGGAVPAQYWEDARVRSFAGTSAVIDDGPGTPG